MTSTGSTSARSWRCAPWPARRSKLSGWPLSSLGSLPLTDPQEACELALDWLVQQELARADLVQRSLITASCGLGTLPVAAAARPLPAQAVAMLRVVGLSKRYGRVPALHKLDLAIFADHHQPHHRGPRTWKTKQQFILCYNTQLMELYIIRHAQSMNNALVDQSTRVADPPLTELGMLQAETLAQHLATRRDLADLPQIAWAYSMSNPRQEPGYGITRLLCSPMWRSLQTTEPIARALGLKPEIWIDIHEVGGVFLEEEAGIVGYGGKTRQDLLAEYPDYLIPEAVTDQGWWTGGLEEVTARDARALRVAVRLRQWSQSNERIAIVTHGGFLSRLIKYLFNEPAGRLVFHQHYNAAISRLEFRADGLLICNYLNRVDFLPPDMLT